MYGKLKGFVMEQVAIVNRLGFGNQTAKGKCPDDSLSVVLFLAAHQKHEQDSLNLVPEVFCVQITQPE